MTQQKVFKGFAVKKRNDSICCYFSTLLKKGKKKAKKDKEKADDIQKHIFSHLEGKHLQWNYKTLMLNEKETNK